MRIRHQKLPPSGAEREALREKGQFWTPDWVAEAMVGYVVAGGCTTIFDPAVGAGAFFRAARKIQQELGLTLNLFGTEMHPAAITEALENGLPKEDLAGVEIRNFVVDPPRGSFAGIVANPPYIRHHRLAPSIKAQLRAFGGLLLGRPLDGRAGIHIYFLLRALELLGRGGRLAFIMPSDPCEGIFSTPLWNWITSRFRLDAVVTFAPSATPFPGVDTNAMIFMIRNFQPSPDFLWVKCTKPETEQLKRWTLSGFSHSEGDALVISRRDLTEGLETGLSREPMERAGSWRLLGDFAHILRGVATGANEFFFLTASRAEGLGIPSEFLVRAVGRTRDVRGDEITHHALEELEDLGRPTMLFSPDGRRLELFPKQVREYLLHGEEIGLPQRPLIASRSPWYKMERRPVPPILFAYLGRRNARFIRNSAGVIPLTGFLCVYPRRHDPEYLEKLWQILRHPETVANLRLVGKSYGAGAIKVEPRALEKLPIPASLVSHIAPAEMGTPQQMGIF
jgi:adenine-specific DNA-methyltransferase